MPVQITRRIGTTVTANGALTAGQHTPVNATSGAITVTLPTTPNAGASMSVEKTDASANTVTINGSLRGTTSSATLYWANESIELVADATNSWWPVAGHKTKAALDGAYDPKGAAAAVSLSLPVNAMTTNGTALIGARNSVNASAGPVAITMPTPTVVGQHMIIERADTSAVAANTITITGTIRGANATITLPAVGAAFEGALYIAESLTSWAIAASIKPRAVLDMTYAPLASPTFTGTPTAPTPNAGDNTTKLATTAFVLANGGTTAAPFSIVPAVGSWILDPSPGSTSSLTQTDQELDLVPRFLPAGTYDAIAVNVSVAGSTGAVFRIAMYSDTNGVPNTLLAQSAAIDATTAGIKQVTLTAPMVVPAGGSIVWGGTVTQGAPTTKPQYTRLAGQLLGSVTTSAPTDLTINTLSSWFVTGVSGAPPSPWTSTSRFNSAPRFAYRRSA